MYEKVFEQAETFFKPFNEIFSMNMEALEKLREQQAELMSELMTESIEYAKGLNNPSMDVGEFIATQQSYLEGVKNKITTNAYSSFDFWSDVQGKSGELWQSAIDSSAKQAAPAAPAKKKSPAKRATKKAAAKVEETKTEKASSEEVSG